MKKPSLKEDGTSPEAIAIIPARGGSKRIPRKNIKNFCGKPIIAYSIEAALTTGLFSQVIVSTDDMEIAEVAKQYGAHAPFVRPDNISDEYTGILPVLQHALEWIQSQGKSVDYICSIMATAPLIQPESIISAFNEMVSKKASGATAVTTFPSCIFRAFTLSKSGMLEMLWPENFLKRSQDFPEVFHDAGQFTWFRVCDFPTNSKELPKKIVPLMLPRYLVQDIDTPEDWIMAEQLYKMLTSSNHTPTDCGKTNS